MTYKVKKGDLVFAGAILLFSAITLPLVQLFFPSVLSSALFSLNKNHIDPDIVIVALDEKTLGEFKRYQDISRCDYATLLRNISRGDPKAVGVDVFFAQKSGQESCDRELIDFIKRDKNVFIGTEYDEEKRKILPLFDGTEVFENASLVNLNGTQSMEEIL